MDFVLNTQKLNIIKIPLHKDNIKIRNIQSKQLPREITSREENRSRSNKNISMTVFSDMDSKITMPAAQVKNLDNEKSALNTPLARKQSSSRLVVTSHKPASMRSLQVPTIQLSNIKVELSQRTDMNGRNEERSMEFSRPESAKYSHNFNFTKSLFRQTSMGSMGSLVPLKKEDSQERDKELDQREDLLITSSRKINSNNLGQSENNYTSKQRKKGGKIVSIHSKNFKKNINNLQERQAATEQQVPEPSNQNYVLGVRMRDASPRKSKEQEIEDAAPSYKNSFQNLNKQSSLNQLKTIDEEDNKELKIQTFKLEDNVIQKAVNKRAYSRGSDERPGQLVAYKIPQEPSEMKPIVDVVVKRSASAGNQKKQNKVLSSKMHDKKALIILPNQNLIEIF